LEYSNEQEPIVDKDRIAEGILQCLTNGTQAYLAQLRHGSVILITTWLMSKIVFLDKTALHNFISQPDGERAVKASTLELLKLPIALVSGKQTLPSQICDSLDLSWQLSATLYACYLKGTLLITPEDVLMNTQGQDLLCSSLQSVNAVLKSSTPCINPLEYHNLDSAIQTQVEGVLALLPPGLEYNEPFASAGLPIPTEPSHLLGQATQSSNCRGQEHRMHFQVSSE
jgi:hypothetical protein